MTGGDDDVEIEVIKPVIAAPLINEVRDVLFHHGTMVRWFPFSTSVGPYRTRFGTSKTSSATTSTASRSISTLIRRIRFSTTVRTVSNSGSSGSSVLFCWIRTATGWEVSTGIRAPGWSSRETSKQPIIRGFRASPQFPHPERARDIFEKNY